MKRISATIGGTALCLLALVSWSYSAPAPGSGLILWLAFFGSLVLLDANGSRLVNVLAGTLITQAAAAVWYFYSTLHDAPWVLLLAVLTGLATAKTLREVVKNDRKGLPGDVEKK